MLIVRENLTEFSLELQTAMADPASIYESVLAEQEKFAQLTEQLAAERRTVANQLEKASAKILFLRLLWVIYHPSHPLIIVANGVLMAALLGHIAVRMAET